MPAIRIRLPRRIRLRTNRAARIRLGIALAKEHERRTENRDNINLSDQIWDVCDSLADRLTSTAFAHEHQKFYERLIKEPRMSISHELGVLQGMYRTVHGASGSTYHKYR